jgi:serine/threonine protein kinase
MDDLIDKKLIGAGMFGSAYLVEINGKSYVLKREKLTKKDASFTLPGNIDKLKSLKGLPSWQKELNFYYQIEDLLPSEKKHFMRLYFKNKILPQWRLITNCKVDHNRPQAIPPKPSNCRGNNRGFCKFIDEMNERDESPYCIEWLIEHKGITLTSCPIKRIRDNLRNICLQICTIGLILDKIGYSHNDIHGDNICIDENNNVSLIDYGMISKKGDPYTFGHKNTFLENNFYFILGGIDMLVSSYMFYIAYNKKHKLKMPWEKDEKLFDNFLSKMYKKYPDLRQILSDLLYEMWPASKHHYIKKFFSAKFVDNLPIDFYYFRIAMFIQSYCFIKYKKAATDAFGWQIYIPPLVDLSTLIKLHSTQKMSELILVVKTM